LLWQAFKQPFAMPTPDRACVIVSQEVFWIKLSVIYAKTLDIYNEGHGVGE
jgi:hypothetical protein